MSVRRSPEHAVPASYGRRCAAALVDAVLALVVAGATVAVVAWAAGSGSPTAARWTPGDPVPDAVVTASLAGAGALCLLALVQWLLHGARGWTVGRLALGVRTLDVESRRPVGPGRVLVRGLVVAAGGLVAGVGAVVVLLSPLFDRTGRLRGWHDLAAGAEVLDVRDAPGRDRAPAGAWTVPPLAQRGAGGTDVPDGRDVPAWSHALGVPAPQSPPVGVPATGPAGDAGGLGGGTGVDGRLVLAPLTPTRQGPDLDTRAMPVVRPVTLAFGLHPELEVTRPSRARLPVPSGPSDGGAAASPASAEIELTDGRRVTVVRAALVGRNPAAEGDVQLIRVVDPTRSVSKTHLQIGVEPGGVWVADRGSTNGTVVTLPDGAQILCGTDQQVRLRVGATVAFGDHGLRLVRAPGTALGS